MADLKTKTISSAQVLTDLGDSAYVLIEDNGQLKKVINTAVGGIYLVHMTENGIDKSYNQLKAAVDKGLWPVIIEVTEGVEK